MRGSGWCEVYEASKINTPGRIDSFLKGNQVKRSRYAHQVTLSVLLTLARDSLEHQTTFDCFNDWKENLAKVSVNAHYWFTVIDLEISLFMFVRSLREANFDLFVRCIKDILPWSFALDHVHYSRWMSVFLYDLICLPEEYRDIFTQFMNCNFTVKKTNHVFSNMGMDQAHEQNNKRVKVDGGAIGILDNEDALLQWAVAGPQIAEILESYYEENEERFQPHHEDNVSYEKTFRQYRESLLAPFLKYVNPFEEKQKNLVNIQSRIILRDESSMSVFNACDIGIKKCLQFRKDRLVTNKVSLYDHITLNKLPLFHQRNTSNASYSV